MVVGFFMTYSQLGLGELLLLAARPATSKSPLSRKWGEWESGKASRLLGFRLMRVAVAR